VAVEQSQITQLFEPTEAISAIPLLRKEFMVLNPDSIAPTQTPYWEAVEEGLASIESSLEAAFQELERELGHKQLNLTTFAHAGARLIERHQAMTGSMFEGQCRRLLDSMQQQHLGDQVTSEQLQQVESAIVEARRQLDIRFNSMKSSLVRNQAQLVDRAYKSCKGLDKDVRAALAQYRDGQPGEFMLANGHVKCVMAPRADQERTVTHEETWQDEHGQWVEPTPVEHEMIYINVMHNEKTAGGKTPTEEEILDSFLVSMLALKDEGCDRVHITTSDPDMRNLAIIAARMAGFGPESIVNHEWEADHSRYGGGWEQYRSTGTVRIVQSDPLPDAVQSQLISASWNKWQEMGKESAAKVQAEIEKRQPEQEENLDMTAVVP